jgi:hypothetical protein
LDGTRHEITGLLGTDGGDFILKMSDGRSWSLRVPHGSERMIGRFVRVSGTRWGAALFVEMMNAV